MEDVFKINLNQQEGELSQESIDPAGVIGRIEYFTNRGFLSSVDNGIGFNIYQSLFSPECLYDSTDINGNQIPENVEIKYTQLLNFLSQEFSLSDPDENHYYQTITQVEHFWGDTYYAEYVSNSNDGMYQQFQITKVDWFGNQNTWLFEDTDGIPGFDRFNGLIPLNNISLDPVLSLREICDEYTIRQVSIG